MGLAVWHMKSHFDIWRGTGTLRYAFFVLHNLQTDTALYMRYAHATPPAAEHLLEMRDFLNVQRNGNV